MNNTVYSPKSREENVKNSRNMYLNAISPFYFTLNAQKFVNNTGNLFSLIEHISFTFFYSALSVPCTRVMHLKKRSTEFNTAAIEKQGFFIKPCDYPCKSFVLILRQ